MTNSIHHRRILQNQVNIHNISFLGETTKLQLFNNFEPSKPLKHKQFRGLVPDPS